MYAPGMGYPGLYAFDEESPEPVAGAPYMLAVDWDGDGLFEGGNEDISLQVFSASCFRGRDSGANLTGKAVAGRLQAELDNRDGKYSRFNASSPLFGNLLPGRRVGLWATSPLSVRLWTGFLDRIEAHAGPLPTATLYASGPFIKLAGENSKVSPAAQQNALTGEIIDAILDDLDWPAAERSIEDGSVPVAHWYIDERSALDAMREMEETEGGFLYEGLNWDVVFEGRYHRLLNSAVSAATFSDDPAEPLTYLLDVQEQDPLKEIFNDFSATVTPHVQLAEMLLWTLPEIVTLGVGESRTYFATLPSDVDGSRVAYAEWTAADVGRDSTVSNYFMITSGAVETLGDIEVTITLFAKTAKIVLENTDVSDPHSITALDLYGEPVVEQTGFRVGTSDATSIAAYGRRTYPLTSPRYPNSAYAQAAVDNELALRKDPHPILVLPIPSGTDSTLFAQAVSLAISDRITAEADEMFTKLGIGQDFYIEAIAHSFGARTPLETVFTLSPVIDVYDGDELFILDSSELDGPDVLGR